MNPQSVFSAVFVALVSYYYPSLILPESRPKCNSDFRQLDAYDFIIVGAGTAGSVIASRLSEVDTWDILVLEAGGHETPFSMTPMLCWQQVNGELDWNYTTVKQEKACRATEGICKYPRGRVMGGTSSINHLTYVRGNRFDYNQWESLGGQKWGYEDVRPYFLRSENALEDNLYVSPYHSQGGQLSVQYPKYISTMTLDIIRAGEELGMINRDYNGRFQCGIDFTQMTVRGAQRWSASSAFLSSASERSNLNVVKNAEVTRVMMDPRTKAALGVEFVTEESKWHIRARKEVILSAGAINSPKLLLLSGIGPREQLNEMGIPPIADLPVGKNLQDHVSVTLLFKLNKKHPLTQLQSTSIDEMLNFAQTKEGPLTTSGISALAFFSLKPSLMADPPEYQFEIMPSYISSEHTVNDSLAAVIVTVLQPESRGYVRLASPDCAVPPLIDPNYFSNESDLNLTVTGLEVAISMMDTDAMKDYGPELYTSAFPECDSKDADKRAFLECVAIKYSHAGHNPVGTARMGPDDDKNTVLNSNLQVLGVPHLRVIDASAAPSITRGGMNAPVIMLAEKAFDIIKKQYNKQ